jgi:hypothetical protein
MFGDVYLSFLMKSENKHITEVARFRSEVAALRRRLRANAKRAKKLSSDTEILVRRVKPEE